MAIAAYRARRVKWEVWLGEEMSEALQASIPDGVSKTDYLKKIFQEHLDKVRCVIHTKEELKLTKEIENDNR